MQSGFLNMAAVTAKMMSPSDVSDLAAEEEDDDWLSGIGDEHLGPGPPPPPFLIPPPPLPDFMLHDLGISNCPDKQLVDHLASCDMYYASAKTSSGILPGLFGSDFSGSGSSSSSSSYHLQFMSMILGCLALFFLALCVAVFIGWRKCRGQNRLSYLRKNGSHFEANPENSEHPLIYDDANINFINPSRLTLANSLNSYQLGPPALRAYQPQAGCEVGSLFRHNRLVMAAAGPEQTNDQESRIYEELYLSEDVLYCDAPRPEQFAKAEVLSRSSTLDSLRQLFHLARTPCSGGPPPPNSQQQHKIPAISCHAYIPPPDQFVTSEGLMALSPDYSDGAIYQQPVSSDPVPDYLQQPEEAFVVGNNAAVAAGLHHPNVMMAESSFSGSSYSSTSTGHASTHNNSTTSTIPATAALSSSSCSSGSTCHEDRHQRRPPGTLRLQQPSRPNGHPSWMPDHLDPGPDVRSFNQLPRPSSAQMRQQRFALLQPGALWPQPPLTPANTADLMNSSSSSSGGGHMTQRMNVRRGDRASLTFHRFSSLWKRRRCKAEVERRDKQPPFPSDAEAGQLGRYMFSTNRRLPPSPLFPINVRTVQYEAVNLRDRGHQMQTASDGRFTSTLHAARSREAKDAYDLTSTMRTGSLNNTSTSSSAAFKGVMPNPDDILPKRAWTDFSGGDEWPTFAQGSSKSSPNAASARAKDNPKKDGDYEAAPRQNNDDDDMDHEERLQWGGNKSKALREVSPAEATAEEDESCPLMMSNKRICLQEPPIAPFTSTKFINVSNCPSSPNKPVHR